MKNYETLAGIAIIVLGLGYVAAQLFPLKPVEPVAKTNLGVCKIIIPHGRIQDGWKFFDPADNSVVSDLVRDGKAETVELPALVECTVYGHNKTPMTMPGDLAMWRKK